MADKDDSEKHNKAGFRTAFEFRDIIGESDRMAHARKLAGRFAPSAANILLVGESGTGKEVFAQAIHQQGRPEGPFMVLNCAAIPRNLIESELFGYDSGAFTGAKKSGSQGKIELAQGGTLFLDEIGDMPLETQAVLLRVLENKQVMRVGGQRYRTVDFRLIAATNKDLRKMAAEGLFRLDLYYRLSVLKVTIPPLRQREKDIIPLAEFFLKKHYGGGGKMPKLNGESRLKLTTYQWPGNVRQLENAMIYALHVCDKEIILPEHLPEEIIEGKIGQNAEAIPPVLKAEREHKIKPMRQMEENIIRNTLAATDNSIAVAAGLLGISKSTLYRKVKLLGLK
ncbi:sigma-54 interaction domain-containing protein [Desulfitobacterium hafniense]|uniref:sigma-54 interaction domain-containing protein n=1 Tax=Desulfitobacterium hafniense TaxID=49338 RepID=UPI001FA78C36|nr:sigma 54-interacting transcriptional regulator [Desulfitobacterium hafniense]